MFFLRTRAFTYITLVQLSRFRNLISKLLANLLEFNYWPNYSLYVALCSKCVCGLHSNWGPLIAFSFHDSFNLNVSSAFFLSFIALILLKSINLLFCSMSPIWGLFCVFITIRFSLRIFAENRTKFSLFLFRGHFITIYSIIDEVT